MIEIENVSVKYRTENDIYTAIANVNLVIPDGGTCAVIGPSGCGKSTLLKCVAGLIPDYEGRVLINGEEVNPKAQTIGFMPQNYGLLPWKTVVDNIRLGMKIKKAPELLDRNVIKQLMRQLGIEGLGHRYPVELSGGQQQRVALATMWKKPCTWGRKSWCSPPIPAASARLSKIRCSAARISASSLNFLKWGYA